MFVIVVQVFRFLLFLFLVVILDLLAVVGGVVRRFGGWLANNRFRAGLVRLLTNDLVLLWWENS